MAKYLLERGALTNDLISPPPGILRGAVVDEEGQPIELLEIELEPVSEQEAPIEHRAARSKTAYSDARGEYVFPALDTGTWDLRIPEMAGNPVGRAVLTPESPEMKMAPLRIPPKVVFTQKMLGFSFTSLSAEEIQALLDNGAEVNCSDRGETPLIRLAQWGDVDRVRVLVEAGADLEAEDANGRTALDHATRREQADIIAYLLEKGARPSDEVPPPPGLIRGFLQDEQGQPLDYVLLQCSVKDQLKFNDPAWMTLSGGSIYFPRLEPGDYQIRLQGLPDPIQTVTLTASDPIQTNVIFRCPRQTALNRALWCQLQFDGPYVLELLEAGADANFQAPETGYTPLMAANRLTPKNARALLEAGADVRRTNHTGQTALMIAIETWDLDPAVVQVFLEAGADVASVDQEGNTALHLACNRGSSEIVTLLIDAGAKLDATDSEGRTPLDLARLSLFETRNDYFRWLWASGSSKSPCFRWFWFSKRRVV